MNPNRKKSILTAFRRERDYVETEGKRANGKSFFRENVFPTARNSSEPQNARNPRKKLPETERDNMEREGNNASRTAFSGKRRKKH